MRCLKQVFVRPHLAKVYVGSNWGIISIAMVAFAERLA